MLSPGCRRSGANLFEAAGTVNAGPANFPYFIDHRMPGFDLAFRLMNTGETIIRNYYQLHVFPLTSIAVRPSGTQDQFSNFQTNPTIEF